MTNEERNIAIADMRRMKAEYMNGREMDEIAERKCKSFDIAIKAIKQTTWTLCSERLPNKEEYRKNNGMFNVTDGNRSYAEWFDVYDKQRFGEPTMCGFRVDRCVIAWQPLPESYKGE